MRDIVDELEEFVNRDQRFLNRSLSEGYARIVYDLMRRAATTIRELRKRTDNHERGVGGWFPSC